MEFPADSLVVGESASSARRHAGLAMYWSTLHWKPIVNGVSGFQPLGNALYLDAFVGDLIRSDGTVATRVSHVSTETVGLLQQLGVRYVVIHRSQYAPGDWPAVERELERAEGALEKAGDFGEARVYLVKEPARPPVTASLTLAVPKAVDPNHAWEPWLLIRNPGETPSLFNIDRPLTLTTRWIDDAGEEVARHEAKPKWPVVAWPGQTACSLNLCRGATDDDRPPARSAPDGATPPYPTSEGRYQVRLELSGAVPAKCEVEVEVTTEIAPNDATSWWECASGEPDRSPALIEEPWAATPAMLVINRNISLVTTFINPSDAEVRAWFYLSRPGEDEPWTRYLHQSAPVQRLVRAGQPAEFGWVEAVDVPDGVYDLTVWFHVKRGDEWVHALGGDLGLGRVVIARERVTAGPFRIVPWERRVLARDGAHATVRLAALGSSPAETCRTTWTLTTVGTEQAPAQPLSWGQSKDCGAVRPAIPPNLEPGRYRVELTAFATGEEGSRRSDRIAVDVIVVDWSPW
jgi:hypothetical protein